MHFPMTKEEAEASRRGLAGLSGIEVCKELRKDANIAKAAKKVDAGETRPGAASPAYTLDAVDKARWFELTPNGEGRFSARITLKNPRKLLSDYPIASRLLVFEFDDGTSDPEAIRVKDADGREGYVISQPIDAWGPGVKEAVAAEGAAEETKGTPEPTEKTKP
jgi:hypothetical protein